MILILNAFITDQRARGNRYPRLEVFKYTLYSYRTIPFSEMFLFIKLDTNYDHVREKLVQYIHKLFPHVGPQRIHIVFDRLYRQPQWNEFITRMYAEKGGNELIMFLNNDDHVFVDSTTTVLKEGLDILSKDTHRFKSIYISHWPEILRLSGKYETPEKVGNYVSFHLSLLDSIQIFNLELLHHVLVTYPWRGDHPRIDDILNELTPIPSQDNPLSQKIFVPLKELFRKFDGYGHVGISHDCPPLHIPTNVFKYDRKTLIAKMAPPHQSAWVNGNAFTIPAEWIETNIALHVTDKYILT